MYEREAIMVVVGRFEPLVGVEVAELARIVARHAPRVTTPGSSLEYELLVRLRVSPTRAGVALTHVPGRPCGTMLLAVRAAGTCDVQEVDVLTAVCGAPESGHACSGNEEDRISRTLASEASLTAREVEVLFNTLGQLSSYTDADEATSTYEYDVDGRIHKTNDGKGTQTYTYSSATGLLGELVDSSHEGMKFTASYDVEGNMLSEGYPNGMTAFYSYDSVGAGTGLEYKKLTHCTEEHEKCKWFTDSVIPSIHGQWLTQTSSLSKQAYTYDAAGRLTQVQNTPIGKGCTTRIYAYDEDTNRTSLTTREPNSKGECATEGGSLESHTYDTADRLTDSGVTYDAFGDITTLPAADTEGQPLTNTFYVDGQAASQTQSEQTIGYNLDPAGRARETVATGKKVSDIISHYAGPGDSPSWTTNTSGETTRNIPAINGQLAAIQNNSEAPVLQLANLHGDVIATAYLSETASELASKADTSEFGVPTTSLPSKYSWLGAIELPTELASGAITMGARSYIPQLGRFLQPDPQPGGSANAYSYTFQDPVNSSDPTGEYTFVAGYLNEFNAEWAAGAEAREATRIAELRAAEAAAMAAAELAALEAEWAAAWAAGPQYAEEWEEWWEEEGGYWEYVSDHQGSESGKTEPHLESGVLYQSLGETTDGEAGRALGLTVPLCKAGVEGPCARATTWIYHVGGRTLKLACTMAAIAAFKCGGDEKFENYLKRNASAEIDYAERTAGESAGEEIVEDILAELL
jgi:RHS repeat-associated protein